MGLIPNPLEIASFDYQVNNKDKWERKFQEKQFKYQAEQDQLRMAREDTAYQRAAIDMRAAGISPSAGVNPAEAGSTAVSGGGSQTGSVGNFGGGDITGLLSIMSQREISKDNLRVAEANAQAQQIETKRHNEAMEAILSRGASTTEQRTPSQIKQAEAAAKASEAAAKASEATAEEQKRSTDYKKEKGYDDSTPNEVKLVKEAQAVLNNLTEAKEAAEQEQLAFEYWKKEHPYRAKMPAAWSIWTHWGDKEEKRKLLNQAKNEIMKSKQRGGR